MSPIKWMMNLSAFSISGAGRDGSWRRVVYSAERLRQICLYVHRDIDDIRKDEIGTHVITDRPDHAANGSTISNVVYVAGLWRVILSIDEMISRAELADRRFPI